ncbi:hypothetical protein MPH_00629 [Macrophomina phaseolina MS6]|uniref:Uncharacterized protein n=1 Tax=Macrophomina phaseolina (strain MS6) TaxID=1126212 RepID=K2S5A3_MACPH|nr:hypothetical protein MPH_00629 [Macrophomina phaseolina MS6]
MTQTEAREEPAAGVEGTAVSTPYTGYAISSHMLYIHRNYEARLLTIHTDKQCARDVHENEQILPLSAWSARKLWRHPRTNANGTLRDAHVAGLDRRGRRNGRRGACASDNHDFRTRRPHLQRRGAAGIRYRAVRVALGGDSLQQ